MARRSDTEQRNVHAWRRYVRFWRADVRTEVSDEVQFHIDSAIDEYVARGATRAEAHAQALKHFGNIGLITDTLHTLGSERERTMQRREWLGTVVQDLLFAFRQLARNPGFTAVALLTLALGIGATSSIFSVVNGVLLQPLPYANADRLLNLRERNGPENAGGMVVSYGNYATWLQQSRMFEALGAYTGDRPRTLTGSGDPLSLKIIRASAGYWRALHIPPVAGRYFNDRDDSPDAEPVVVLSETLWKRRFASDPHVIGQRIQLNGVPHAVVGVAPAAYAMSPQSLESPNVWLPLGLTVAQRSDHADHELSVVGLLRPNVTKAQAMAELTGIETGLAKQFPHSYFDGGIIAVSQRDKIVGDIRPTLLILFGTVCMVLLIACTNVANLLLARAAVRRKELAIRSALGGARSRVFRQLMLESAALALTGALLGLGVAAGGTRFLVQSAPADIPRLQYVALDWPVVLFTLVIAMISALLFGLIPALRASDPDLRGTLNEGSREGAASLGYSLRATLVAGQVSIALVLLVLSALLLRSAQATQNVDPGFNPRNVLVAGIALPSARYSDDALVAVTFDQILQRVSAVAGVTSAAFISRIPIGSGGMDGIYRGEGSAAGAKTAGANIRMITPTLFRTFGIPVLRGRSIEGSDVSTSPAVVVINSAFARQLFGTDDVVGKRVTAAQNAGSPPVWRTIAGVIGDVRANGLRNNPPNEIYYPLSQLPERSMTLVVRTRAPISGIITGIRSAVQEVDPQLPVSEPSQMDEILAYSLAIPRFTTLLIGLLGAFGLLLAIIGIYGVIAYFVVQRTREIGVRIALGARPTAVVRLVVGQGFTLVSIGIMIGLVAAWLSASVLQSELYATSAHDPVVFAGVAALLFVIAITASAVPAWRAARVDPLVAMRS